MRKSILASEKRSSSAIGFSCLRESAIEVVGTVAGYMWRKLDKPMKRKPPG